MKLKTLKNKRLPKAEQLATYVIENDVPITGGRGTYTSEARDKITKILKAIKPKQSFVIEANKVPLMHRITKEEFEAYKMQTSKLPPDKTFARVWRVA